MSVKIIYRTQAQIRFLEKYLTNGGNATKAWEALHPKCNHNSAIQQGYMMMKKLDLSLAELLDRMGLTDGKLVKKLEAGLDAVKVVGVSPMSKSSKDVPLDPNQPQLKYLNIPDMGIRVKYLDMAFKLKGKYPSDKATESIALTFAELMKAKAKQEAE